MKVTGLKQTDNTITFNVNGANLKILNALRRCVIVQVPVMAIDEVTFFDNTSILADEILAHRMGLTPIRTDLKTYNAIEDCTCKGEGCAKCSAAFTLDVKGPGNVTASDLIPSDPEVKPIYPDTLLVKLDVNQSIKLEAKARLGTGTEHIKWQSGLASFEAKNDGSYDFMVESYGQLTPKELVLSAFNEFNKKIDELKAGLK